MGSSHFIKRITDSIVRDLVNQGSDFTTEYVNQIESAYSERVVDYCVCNNISIKKLTIYHSFDEQGNLVICIDMLPLHAYDQITYGERLLADIVFSSAGVKVTLLDT
jgi:hypothetical protein